jgi:hypothetical protein
LTVLKVLPGLSQLELLILNIVLFLSQLLGESNHLWIGLEYLLFLLFILLSLGPQNRKEFVLLFDIFFHIQVFGLVFHLDDDSPVFVDALILVISGRVLVVCVEVGL